MDGHIQVHTLQVDARRGLGPVLASLRAWEQRAKREVRAIHPKATNFTVHQGQGRDGYAVYHLTAFISEKT